MKLQVDGVRMVSVDTQPRTSAARIAGGVVAAVLAAVVVNTVISLLARAAGASDAFEPLQPSAYVFFTVVGVLAGAAGWAAVRRWSRRPAGVLRWLVPAVVGLSLVPDVALLYTDVQPNTSRLAVAALMTMHLATAAVAVPIFARALPLPT
jgi:hypothetical protein